MTPSPCSAFVLIVHLDLQALPRDARIKLFYAARPDERAGEQIASLADCLNDAHNLNGRPIDRCRLHNTLAAVHGAPTLIENIRRAKAAGNRLRHRRFSVSFDSTGSFQHRDGRHPFVLRTSDPAPLADLRAALGIEMLREGLAVAASFTPHVTLLWGDRLVEDYPVSPIRWTVRDFVLIASLQGYSCHIELARWALY